ncbi:M14 family zinc carboxypeptidase [Streptomyces sp. SGAir0957]
MTVTIDTSTDAGRAMATHDRYPTLDQVIDAAHVLAQGHPELCRLRTVGRSREGEPLWLLSVGRSAQHALILAGAHADEPLGGATIVELAHRTATNASVHRGVTWNFLLCLDPDGARLAEADAHGDGGDSSTLAGHFTRAFRPAADEQPEWAPSLGVMLPETQALLDVISTLRPFLQCSLHNNDVGGAFVETTRPLPALAEPFTQSAAALGIPVEAGTYDAFYWDSCGPGIYVMPPPQNDKRWAISPGDAGTTTWHAPRAYGGTTLIIESPLWTSTRLADPTVIDNPAPLLENAADRLRHRWTQLSSILAAAAPHLSADTPLLRAVHTHMDVCAPMADEWDPRIVQPGAPPWPTMTQARYASIEMISLRVPIRAAAMLRRALPDEPPTARLRSRLQALLNAWCLQCEQAFQGVWLPVAHQVEQQIATVVAAVELTRPPANVSA